MLVTWKAIYSTIVGIVGAAREQAVPVFLVAIAVLAAYLPAHCATRVDPMIALRAD